MNEDVQASNLYLFFPSKCFSPCESPWQQFPESFSGSASSQAFHFSFGFLWIQSESILSHWSKSAFFPFISFFFFFLEWQSKYECPKKIYPKEGNLKSVRKLRHRFKRGTYEWAKNAELETRHQCKDYRISTLLWLDFLLYSICVRCIGILSVPWHVSYSFPDARTHKKVMQALLKCKTEASRTSDFSWRLTAHCEMWVIRWMRGTTSMWRYYNIKR